MLRARPLLIALLVASTAAAGCFGASEPDPAPTQPPASQPPATQPPASSPPPAQPAPTTVTVRDAGEIAGPFEKAWNLDVPQVGFRGIDIAFALTGVQEGLPPTARIYFALQDANGETLISAILTAAEPSLTWSPTAGDIPQAGMYKLVASAEPTTIGGVPSFGFANYALDASVQY